MANIHGLKSAGIAVFTGLMLVACQRQASPPAEAPAAQAPKPAPVVAAVADGDWPSYNRTLDSQRYSPLAEITTANVATLQQACVADLGEGGNFQSGLIVVDGTLYATTETTTFAIDPATCATKWKHSIDKPAAEGLRVNRGVAVADGKVFRGINSGHVLALDAATGKQLWQTQMADPAKGEAIPAAPIAWNGMVFIGQAGGDNRGVRGRMHAFNAADGTQAWVFDLVPLQGPGADTWPANDPANPRTGGATWTSYTLDPATGLLYVPAGNAAPDFDLKARPGLNLYTNSIVILDAKTGAFREHYQLTPYDYHDWDIAAAPALVSTRGGKSLIVAAGKDGVLHAVEPAQKKEIYKTAVTTMENVATPFSDKETHFCPGFTGGVQWNGPAFHPATNLLFVNAVDWCASVNLMAKSPPPGEMGKPYTGEADADAPFGVKDPVGTSKGWVHAIDADDGSIAWKYQAPTPMLAGITPTAGGVVFTGDLKGNVLAFNAADGKVLWTGDAGAPVAGGVITYLASGKQHVAVAAGMTADGWETSAGNARVVVFKLPGTASPASANTP